MAQLWGMWAADARKFVRLGPVRTRAKKLAQRTKNGPKLVLYGVLGDLFRENTDGWVVRGDICRAVGLMPLVLGGTVLRTGVDGMPCGYMWAWP